MQNTLRNFITISRWHQSATNRQRDIAMVTNIPMGDGRRLCNCIVLLGYNCHGQ